MRYRLQRHDGTDCSATMVPITVLRMVPIQCYRQKHVYSFEKDILKYPIGKWDIFANSVLNKINFGQLFILPNNKVYSNINERSLGSLSQNSIQELIYKEMTQRNNWMKIRNKKPCSNCIYQYLCPPPSKYESMIGKMNLCHIKERPNHVKSLSKKICEI